MGRLGDWLEERTGYRGALRVALDEPVLGGASMAYVFGSVLAFLLLLQMVTGVLLATVYSPSATDAWASVAYIQDQVPLGWFVRGLHSHGASAMVIVAGLHMLQTALYGAYKRPRELNWVVGVLMLGLILAFALTGYLLPWDQTGYWATKVATGIAGTTPAIGEEVQALAQGGNEYGNLTLTRFYALHVLVLPATIGVLFVVHLVLFRRHGVTPHWWLERDALERRARRFWPDQMFRDMVAMAAAFAALVAVNIYTGGAPLDAPADPSTGFDARPEWYFRPLFQALKYFEGTAEHVVALGAPAIVGVLLFALPLIDRGASRCPLRRWKPLALLGALAVATGALTVVSLVEDASDPQYQAALGRAEEQARRARTLALMNGVPPAGGPAVFTTEPHHRARTIWAEACAGCHQGDALEGPEIGPGYNSRGWIRAFLLDPSGPRFFGPTEMRGMDPVDLRGGDLDAVVELIYAETGAEDADPALIARGRELFSGDGGCDSCHAIDGEEEGGVGPNLGRRGSAEMLAEFIGRPDHPRWFGDDNEMPPFYDPYDRATRMELAELILSWRAKPIPPR
ncbi:MAG TPA: cytochrome b N-terminal domain-containing protein [Kofleriaceae bacterium]|nr:cytochrome b N-terminal domain-containing protein [Kofleriaceae bacterium]